MLKSCGCQCREYSKPIQVILTLYHKFLSDNQTILSYKISTLDFEEYMPYILLRGLILLIQMTFIQ